MSGVDPDDPGQRAVLTRKLASLALYPDGDDWAHHALTALRDHLAVQPRVVEFPAEDDRARCIRLCKHGGTCSLRGGHTGAHETPYCSWADVR